MIYDELETLLRQQLGTNANQTVDMLRKHLGGQTVYFPLRRPILLGGERVSVAASRLGVARTTIYRRLK